MLNSDLSATGTTSEIWNDVRSRFKLSMMAKTELTKLAANIDVTWPLRGKDEIPLKYLPHSAEELMLFPEIAEKPERLGLLVSILEETMAFDDPFGEMAEHVDSSSKRDDSAEKTMKALGIDEAYPIALCHLSEETRSFCAAEQLKTLGEFVAFTQNIAQSVVVGGDFRAFLNAFVSADEKALATFLPVRRGETGLHLAEAVGLVIQDGTPAAQAALYRHFDATLSDELRTAPTTEPEMVVATAKAAVQARLDYFSAQAEDLKAALNQSPADVDRFFVPLGEPGRETVAIGLTRALLAPRTVKKKGFLARLFGG